MVWQRELKILIVFLVTLEKYVLIRQLKQKSTQIAQLDNTAI